MDAETLKALGVVALVSFVWWLIGCYQIHRDRMRARAITDKIARNGCECYCCTLHRDAAECEYRYVCDYLKG